VEWNKAHDTWKPNISQLATIQKMQRKGKKSRENRALKKKAEKNPFFSSENGKENNAFLFRGKVLYCVPDDKRQTIPLR
jgi:short subunit dehydrogenase-like uncharacterized protein